MSQELLQLVDGHEPGIEQDGRDRMPEQVRIDAFLYAGGADTGRDNRLHRAGLVTGLPVTLEQESSLAPMEMSAKFIGQRRQYWHVAISPALGTDNVNLWRVTI